MAALTIATLDDRFAIMFVTRGRTCRKDFEIPFLPQAELTVNIWQTAELAQYVWLVSTAPPSRISGTPQSPRRKTDEGLELGA